MIRQFLSMSLGVSNFRPGSGTANPNITTTTVSEGTDQAAYSQQFVVSGLQSGTWLVTTGTPPTGLTFSTGGLLAGTINDAGSSFNFTVKYTDPQGRLDTQAITMVVNDPIALDAGALDGGTEGVAYSEQVLHTGGTTPVTFTISAGSLPNGLSMSSSGAITGTPTVVNTFNFTVAVSDANGSSDTQAYSITIDPDEVEWAGDGSDMADLGGTGGDATALFTGGKLGIPGSPIHWSWDEALPASKEFDLTITLEHTNGGSANLINSFNFLSTQKTRRLGSYSASEGNPNAGDKALCLVVNGAKLSATGLTGDLLELQYEDGTTYNVLAVYAGSSISDGTPRTFVVHVDGGGSTVLVSVDMVGTGEVIASTDTGISPASFGLHLTGYNEGSGSGTTPLTDCTVDMVKYVETA